jgi:amidohydrolase
MRQNWIQHHHDQLIQIRRHLHQYPETGLNEFCTSEFLKRKLKESGYFIINKDNIVPGFYCEYGQKENPVLVLRAEMDGLPISDKKEVTYKSKNNGIMHACGHDVHMAIVLGCALWLKKENIPLPGKIRFIFQPAEEASGGGAQKVIETGLIDDVDAILGIHVQPRLAATKIALKDGPICAAACLVDITIKGPGGHTSRPHETIDLISVASKLILKLETNITKLDDPQNSVVLCFGKIMGAGTFNVIPGEIKLQGTLRFVNWQIREKLIKELETIINKVMKETKAEIILNIPYTVPVVYNNDQLTAKVLHSARKAIGKQNVVLIDKASLGGDDFGFYLQKIPGIYIRIGSDDGNTKDLHSDTFDVDEECIKTGFLVLSQFIQDFFACPP